MDNNIIGYFQCVLEEGEKPGANNIFVDNDNENYDNFRNKILKITHIERNTQQIAPATPTDKRRRHEEDDLQRATAELVRIKYARRCVAFHVPNGGRRNRTEAARLKGMGVLAGVADWIVLLPGGRFAAIELKRRADCLLPSEWEVRRSVEDLRRVVPDELRVAIRQSLYHLGKCCEAIDALDLRGLEVEALADVY